MPQNNDAVKCFVCYGTGLNNGQDCYRCNGTGNIHSVSQDEKDRFYSEQRELKGKALAKFERRERQAEQGCRKGWHR